MADLSNFLPLIEEILETETGTVEWDSNLEELGWDSLSDINFIAAADERYGAVIDPEKLATSTTPADLRDLVASLAA